MSGRAERGDKLIHDPAARTDIFMLGGLTEFREIETGHCDTGERRERQGDETFQRRGGTEASTDGNLAVNKQVCTAEMVSSLLQGGGDAMDEVAPVLARRTGESVERQRTFLVRMFGVNLDDAIGTFSGGDPGVKADRHRHGEAVVVIGVLADQINATGCPKNLRARAESPRKRESRRLTVPSGLETPAITAGLRKSGLRHSRKDIAVETGGCLRALRTQTRRGRRRKIPCPTQPSSQSVWGSDKTPLGKQDHDVNYAFQSDGMPAFYGRREGRRTRQKKIFIAN